MKTLTIHFSDPPEIINEGVASENGKNRTLSRLQRS